ncbi:hypothetical protein EDD37DRAFT_630495 [Exophiala viscosa]|uniref:Uncharacterized protein n=1 Tax=Exophiala viscosa TaxID=2486360 RepID=A0AAN6IFA8_9EURO|nr:hypothetical protein EDD36DRAFT_167969 [Exophiala viscosa]KAI1624216.1 hypothetical protein EDD37DRAFT_630495 [Exophiala viscosa]
MDMQETRIGFLQESARMLFLSSPSTSRYLSAQRNEVVLSGTARKRVRIKGACTACGSLLVPAWTSDTKAVTGKVKRGTDGTSKPDELRNRVVSSRCSTCNRITKDVVKVQLTSRKSLTKPFALQAKQEEAVPHEELVAEQPSKVTSKRRAKARKDREGLQALLSKSAQNKPSRGLNLMDLMKR